MSDEVIHLSKQLHLNDKNQLPQVKQTKTTIIRIKQNKQGKLLKRTDSSDDSHCNISNNISNNHINNHSLNHQIISNNNQHTHNHHNNHNNNHRNKLIIRDDNDIKVKRKFSLPSVQTKYDNIFNGHLIFWKLCIAAQISLFHHLEFDCIEISIFDLNHRKEMERLYLCASKLFELLEDLVDISDYRDRKISFSEAIKTTRINSAIDFIMSHLGCEKVSFMPPAATLRYYNEKTNKIEPLTMLKPLWLTPANQQAIPAIISVLYASRIRHASATKSSKLHFIWAVKLVISMTRIRKSIISAWKRATQSSAILRRIQQTRELSETLTADGLTSYNDNLHNHTSTASSTSLDLMH